MVFERIKKVDGIISSIHEMIPKVHEETRHDVNGVVLKVHDEEMLSNVNGVVLKVKEVLPQVEEMIPKVKTFLDKANGIFEALPTKRQVGFGVLGIGLVVCIAIWLYKRKAMEKKASNEEKASKEKKANKDEKAG